MMEDLYFRLYEIEMISGEVRRGIHFLEKASKGNGFYSKISSILLDSIKNHRPPELAEDEIMKVEGDEGEKRAIYFRYLYSYNRYDIDFPKYDAKRCDDS